MGGLQRRSIATCIILSFVTCAIYEYYWLYKLAEDINYIKGDPNATTPGMVLVLSIVTCGIYLIYWVYKAGETVDNARMNMGMAPGSKAVLYLVLTIFGLGLVAIALLQNDINEFADNGLTGGSGADTRFGGYGQGGYNQGGYNQGGYNQGGYNQGGYNPGGYNPGGYDQGQSGYGGQGSAPGGDPYKAQNSYLEKPESPFTQYTPDDKGNNPFENPSDQK